MKSIKDLEIGEHVVVLKVNTIIRGEVIDNSYKEGVTHSILTIKDDNGKLYYFTYSGTATIGYETYDDSAIVFSNKQEMLDHLKEKVSMAEHNLKSAKALLSTFMDEFVKGYSDME